MVAYAFGSGFYYLLVRLPTFLVLVLRFATYVLLPGSVLFFTRFAVVAVTVLHVTVHTHVLHYLRLFRTLVLVARIARSVYAVAFHRCGYHLTSLHSRCILACATPPTRVLCVTAFAHTVLCRTRFAALLCLCRARFVTLAHTTRTLHTRLPRITVPVLHVRFTLVARFTLHRYLLRLPFSCARLRFLRFAHFTRLHTRTHYRVRSGYGVYVSQLRCTHRATFATHAPLHRTPLPGSALAWITVHHCAHTARVYAYRVTHTVTGSTAFWFHCSTFTTSVHPTPAVRTVDYRFFVLPGSTRGSGYLRVYLCAAGCLGYCGCRLRTRCAPARTPRITCGYGWFWIAYGLVTCVHVLAPLPAGYAGWRMPSTVLPVTHCLDLRHTHVRTRSTRYGLRCTIYYTGYRLRLQRVLYTVVVAVGSTLHMLPFAFPLVRSVYVWLHTFYVYAFAFYIAVLRSF